MTKIAGVEIVTYAISPMEKKKWPRGHRQGHLLQKPLLKRQHDKIQQATKDKDAVQAEPSIEDAVPAGFAEEREASETTTTSATEETASTAGVDMGRLAEQMAETKRHVRRPLMIHYPQWSRSNHQR